VAERTTLPLLVWPRALRATRPDTVFVKAPAPVDEITSSTVLEPGGVVDAVLPDRGHVRVDVPALP